jgi:HD-like signal output (HDOD) protein
VSGGVSSLLRGGTAIPGFPVVYARLVQVLANPRASASQVADVLGEDTALTGRLLRLVNSAFYAFPHPVETVSRAVLVVGTQQIRDLALATSVMTMFPRLPGDLVDPEAFWRHSVAAGVAARVLATCRREPNVERFFVAGILHDIGWLLLCVKRPDAAREVLRRRQAEDSSRVQCERAILGFDHAAVGGALLEAWRLPAVLGEAVLCHHEPGQALRHPTEAAVLHIADIVAHALEADEPGEDAVPPLDPEAWNRVGLAPVTWEIVLEQSERQMKDALEVIRPGSAP